MSTIEDAVRFFIDEINTVCLAEQTYLAGGKDWEKQTNAHIARADALLGQGWDILLGLGYSERDIAEIRRLAHATFGSKMGWDEERPLYVLDRAYPIKL